MSTVAEAYAARHDAEQAQRRRLLGEPEADRWGGAGAQRLRADVARPLSPHQEYVASFLRPSDVLLDVGGGAGRNGLPLADRCQEVVNVDSSGGMRRLFDEAAAATGITNVRFVLSDWLRAEGVTGDVALAAHVTYFVRDIVPFLEKLRAATRRLVVISVLSEPMPNRFADFFRAFHGEPKVELPGYQELLPVLWALDVLPEVRVFPSELVASRTAPTREAAVEMALTGDWYPSTNEAAARACVERGFDEFFVQQDGLYHLRRSIGAHEVLITWPTGE